MVFKVPSESTHNMKKLHRGNRITFVSFALVLQNPVTRIHNLEQSCYSLAVACKKRATRSLYRPSPHWSGEDNRKKKAKTGGSG